SATRTADTATMTMVWRLIWIFRRPAPDPLGSQGVIALPGSGPVGVIDAEPGGRHGLQACRADGDAADLTRAVRPPIEPGDGRVDLFERVLQLAGQGFRLAALGRDLAGVGEIGVVVEPGPTVVEPELGQLTLQVRLLDLQEVPVVGGGGVGGGIAGHPGNVTWPRHHRPAGGPGGKTPADGPGSVGCRSGWWRWTHGRAPPGPRGCRRRGPACGWHRSGAARGD